jgi:glycosyltransferase involved in cell wall biosynthesis
MTATILDHHLTGTRCKGLAPGTSAFRNRLRNGRQLSLHQLFGLGVNTHGCRRLIRWNRGKRGEIHAGVAPGQQAMKSIGESDQMRPQLPGVLIVCQPTSEGVGVCVRDLVGAAVLSGYGVTVACPAAGDLAAWSVERGATWQRLEMRRSPHFGDVKAVMQVRRLARSHALVHLHSSKAGAVGRIALASLGRRRPPSVFTPHGWSWLSGGWLSPLYRLLELTLLPLTSAVVAVSQEERAAGLAALGPRATRIKVIPNGVDGTRFSPDGRIAARTDDPLVVSVGRLSRARGPDIAVAALALMRTPNARLRLVGDGEDRARIEHQVSALGLTDRVELVGFRADPAPDLRAADVVIIPSRYDGMSLILLEAMACGAAIVATRVSGTCALAGAGVVVPVEQPVSLACAVDALLADPARRRQLGNAARSRAVESYSLGRSIDGTLGLWQELGIIPGSARNDVELGPGGAHIPVEVS